MENMKLRKHTHTFIANSHTASLAMHKDSHIVSKSKPKIRIIHIFAPEIIKTDVENFRELVQKLTGKPSGETKCCKKKKTRVIAKREQESRSSSSSGSGVSEDHTKKIEMRNNICGGFWGLDVTRERVKEEEVGVCCSDASSGGYLGGFSDLEGFISEINGGFPLLPLDGNHLMQGFEESQLL
ncbi:VQ motif-containing protein 25-like [Abrus precatorius]|uniref:VQ motif-containing protein 25-like n=1 Tax=Abrus precatorius TaxID=3816 RepID=A0A8B8MIW3_ABRPR|nr:VQ motif-containing protein 25-like [Abrus precatorius]